MGTKDRVRAALQRAEEEESGPHRRKRTMESSSSRTDEEKSVHRRKNLYDPESERRDEEQRRRDEQRAKAKNRPLPPALNFNQLLQLAEKKQFEPVELEVEVKQKEADRLLTKREKREMEERQRFFAEREQRKQNRSRESISKGASPNASISEPRKMEPNGRIPKIGSKPAPAPHRPNLEKQQNGDSKYSSESRTPFSGTSKSKDDRDRKSGLEFRKPSSLPSSSSSQPRPMPTKPSPKAPRSQDRVQINTQKTTTTSRELLPKDVRKPLSSKDSKSVPVNRQRDRNYPPLDINRTAASQNTNNGNVKTRPQDIKTRPFPPQDIKTRPFLPQDVKTRQFPPPDVKTRPFPPSDLKTRPFPPPNVKARQFPPGDMRRPLSIKKPMKRKSRQLK